VSWIHAVIDVPGDQHTAAGGFWASVFGWPTGRPWDGHPELCSFEPPAGAAYLHLQRIVGPPRLHLDLESEKPDETVQRAVDLGARLAARTANWQTLRSPGGLPFCVLRAKEHTAPDPVEHPDGHRTRMVQVCIDSPRQSQEAEVAFWRSLVAASWTPSDDEEFVGRLHDDSGSPIQLLFQRLHEEDGPVRAHLDLGTDDMDAEVRRLLALGAADLGPGDGWHAFTDIVGHPFCITPNSPEQTRHRDFG
jgi:hypothetical protein